MYIGTTAGEVLHFVSIPDDPQSTSQNATFILASRLEPSPPSSAPDSPKGVQQIVVLPRSNKACILCNGTLTFHSLPELSPAVGNRKVSNCAWIGGLDLDLDLGVNEGTDDDAIMVSIKDRVRVIRISDDPQLLKNIKYPGCLAGTRRGRYACVADSRSYSLLDVENQQKIVLFPISSLDEAAAFNTGKQSIEDTTAHVGRSSSVTHRRVLSGSDGSGHSRTTSLGAFVGGIGRRPQDSRSRSRERSGLDTPEPASGRASPAHAGAYASPKRRVGSPEKPLPPPPPAKDTVAQTPAPKEAPPLLLDPNITSPLSTEFLLTTGTLPSEPGVGIFVNCDGDVVRGTLEFSHYPSSIIIDGGDPSAISQSTPADVEIDGYVLAAIEKHSRKGDKCGIEIQRWDSTGEKKSWLPLKDQPTTEDNSEEANGHLTHNVGLGKTRTEIDISFQEVGEMLRSRRFVISSTDDPGTPDPAEITRNLEEDAFVSKLGNRTTQILTWTGTSVSWIVRSPIVMRLNAVVERILDDAIETQLDQNRLISLMTSIRDQEARSEAEFLSLEYIRQKISIVLFADLAVNSYNVNPQINEQLLIEGGVDPRVIISMIPLLRNDIVEKASGIWIHAGLVTLMKERFAKTVVVLEDNDVLSRPEEYDILSLIRAYLGTWRQRKGFGSIMDEAEVFATVDAALLHVLLYQDQQSSLGPGASASVRAELYSIVDYNINCFDRAIELLEEYRRLYVLSRLYQSRKMRGKVLETWRRILEGEPDDGKEFVDGENEVRKYLAMLKDANLVMEYGTWLARRNPTLGVQIFTDDNSKVKLPPSQVVELLQRQAPESVKVYLEHLVFGKKQIQYANELISYYLDNVLNVLNSSEEARSILSQSYSTYRALVAPKPTYREFITDNAISAPWWNDRLRLLELLGGSHGAGFSYDIPLVLSRIEPFEDALVPESIILDGRQGRHPQALRLLTHGLGDYHTAINYCLLGGSSIFHPTQGGGIDLSSVPTVKEQSKLFKTLFHEFLQISDLSDRIERTSELIGRFGNWFDPRDILQAIPNDWPVETVSFFVTGVLRRLVSERNETIIVKSLSSAQNLKMALEFVEKCEQLGPLVVPAVDTPTSLM